MHWEMHSNAVSRPHRLYIAVDIPADFDSQNHGSGLTATGRLARFGDTLLDGARGSSGMLPAASIHRKNCGWPAVDI